MKPRLLSLLTPPSLASLLFSSNVRQLTLMIAFSVPMPSASAMTFNKVQDPFSIHQVTVAFDRPNGIREGRNIRQINQLIFSLSNDNKSLRVPNALHSCPCSPLEEESVERHR